MTFRRALVAAFSTALLLGLAWGCAAVDNSGSPVPAGGGSNGVIEPGNDASVIMAGGGRQDAGTLYLNPLCGKPADVHCVPDSPDSCSMFVPPMATKGDAGASSEDAGREAGPSTEDAGLSSDAADSGQAGAPGEGGSGGERVGPLSSSGAGNGGAAGVVEQGASGAAGEAGATSGPVTPPPTKPKYACQIQRTNSAPKEVSSSCAFAGPGGEDAPCLTSSDCQAGLGCVGDQISGLCQRYCCQDADDCAHGTYCAERPMRDALTNSSAAASLLIPVCVHAENCDLSALYPCPKAGECACGSGTACLVVRSDGTTTCAVPGTGKVGEACPCAWGNVCSAATGQCLQLCRTPDGSTCGTGKCQAASELPDGWGVCVGVTPSGG